MAELSWWHYPNSCLLISQDPHVLNLELLVGPAPLVTFFENILSIELIWQIFFPHQFEACPERIAEAWFGRYRFAAGW